MNACPSSLYRRPRLGFAVLALSLFVPFDAPQAASDNPLDPPQPRTPDGEIITSSTARYEWDAVAGATWYRLWVDNAGARDVTERTVSGEAWYTAEQAGCPGGTGICSVTPTSALTAGAAEWWVHAWNNETGNSDWSEPLRFTVQSPTPPIEPLNDETVEFELPEYTWEPDDEATWYQLHVVNRDANQRTTVVMQWYPALGENCTAERCTAKPDLPVAVPFATEMAPPVLEQPGWRVRAWSAENFGAWSAWQDFTIDVTPPDPPNALQPSGRIETARPVYSWDAVPGATWYRLWVDNAGRSDVIIPIEDVRGAAWYSAAEADCPDGSGICRVEPDTELLDGDSSWWVQAWNAGGESAWSAHKDFQVDTATQTNNCPEVPAGVSVVDKPTPLMDVFFKRETIIPSNNNVLYAFTITTPASGIKQGVFSTAVTSASRVPRLLTLTSCRADEARIGDAGRNLAVGQCWATGGEGSDINFTTNPFADPRNWCILQHDRTYYINASSSVLDPSMFWIPPEDGRVLLVPGERNCTTPESCSFFAEGSLLPPF